MQPLTTLGSQRELLFGNYFLVSFYSGLLTNHSMQLLPPLPVETNRPHVVPPVRVELTLPLYKNGVLTVELRGHRYLLFYALRYFP